MLGPAAETILSPSFNHRPLAKDRVRLPGEVTESGSPGRGLGPGQNGLQVACLLQVQHVGATQEDHHVVRGKLEWLVRIHSHCGVPWQQCCQQQSMKPWASDYHGLSLQDQRGQPSF